MEQLRYHLAIEKLRPEIQRFCDALQAMPDAEFGEFFAGTYSRLQEGYLFLVESEKERRRGNA